MKISKYEEKVLRLLNNEGLKNEKKALKKEGYVNAFKTYMLYSLSVVSIAAGAYFAGDSYVQWDKTRPAVEIYDDNADNIDALKEMSQEFYEVKTGHGVPDANSLKTRREISDKLEDAANTLSRMNKEIELSDEYITQAEEKEDYSNKILLGMGIFLVPGWGGMLGAKNYSKRKEKKLAEKKETLNQYLN